MKIFKTKEAEANAVAGGVAATPNTHTVKRSVITRPHVSEKAYSRHAENQYVFIVDTSANKTLVKEEVERRYHVHVTDVDMVVHKGKVKHFRGRAVRPSMSKKAYVTLKEGDKIEIA